MAVIEISSWTELNAIRADVSASAQYALRRSLLKTDPDYIGIGDSWIPISNIVGQEAECKFDMCGFTIEGLTSGNSDSYSAGLFDRVMFSFELKNGVFDDMTLTSGVSHGQGVIGRIRHSSPGWAVRNIKVVNSSINHGTNFSINGGVVGVIGDTRGGTTSVDGSITDGVIEDCSVENTKIGGYNYNGSIVGHLRGGTIRRCASKGNTVNPGSVYPTYSGGICHTLGSSLIEDCYVDDVLVQGNRTDYWGGIASRIGGATCTVRRCWVGQVTFDVTLSGGDRRAILSASDGTNNVSDCYYDSVSPVSSAGGGTAKTTAEMQYADTFANWDFDDVWYICEGEDYPRLRGVDIPPVRSPAELAILGARFKLGTVTYQYTSTPPYGIVLMQEPIGGTKARTGSPINITVSIEEET